MTKLHPHTNSTAALIVRRAGKSFFQAGASGSHVGGGGIRVVQSVVRPGKHRREKGEENY